MGLGLAAGSLDAGLALAFELLCDAAGRSGARWRRLLWPGAGLARRPSRRRTSRFRLLLRRLDPLPFLAIAAIPAVLLMFVDAPIRSGVDVAPGNSRWPGN